MSRVVGGVSTLIALWCGLFLWRALLDIGVLIELALGSAVLVGIGVALRALGRRPGLVAAVQGVAALAWAFAPLPGHGGHPIELVREGVETLRDAQAPVPTTPGVLLLAVALTAVLTIITDSLVAGLGAPAWAVTAVVVFFLVRAIGLRMEPVGALDVLAVALGIIAVLFAGRTASGVTASVARGGRLAGTLAASAVLSVALAMGAAAVVKFPPARLDQGPIQMNDPSIDLKRNLARPAAQPVLEYTTENGDGTYLKLTTLSNFDARGFGLSNARVRSDVPGGDLSLPEPPGVTRPTRELRTSVTIGTFESEWLPAPYAPRSIAVDGEWGYLWPSLSVLSVGTNRTSATKGLTYTVTSAVSSPDVAGLEAAEAGRPEDIESTQVPADLPPEIAEVANRVTQGRETAGAKAIALEEYLTSGTFRYSLDPAPGSSYSSLVDFLTETNTGYCEQFAGAMAAMARTLGIPSRVVVGFTPGTASGTKHTVSSHDMHTWPELYFEGYGWVAFEPTPGRGAGGQEPGPTPTASATPTASPTPTAQPTSTPTAVPTQAPAPTAGGGSNGSPLWFAGVLAALAVAAAAPATLRVFARRRRLSERTDAASAALDAWDEIRAAAVDLGRSWPSGSPRYVAAGLASELGDEATAALQELAEASERALYGPPDAAGAARNWAGAVSTVVTDLGRGADPLARLVARWWPRSLWR